LIPEVERVVKGLVRLKKELNTLAERRKAEQAVMERNPSGATRNQVKGIYEEFTNDLEKIRGWKSWLEESKTLLETLHPRMFPYPSQEHQIDIIIPVIDKYYNGLKFLERDRVETLRMLGSWLDSH